MNALEQQTQNSSKAVLWKQHIEDWKHSGDTQAAFCRKHRLSPAAFCYWKRKLEPIASKNTPFLPVAITPDKLQAPADSFSGVSLTVDGRFDIRLGNRFDGPTLLKLIELLEAR